MGNATECPAVTDRASDLGLIVTAITGPRDSTYGGQRDARAILGSSAKGILYGNTSNHLEEPQINWPEKAME
jgi:hypothetical protein